MVIWTRLVGLRLVPYPMERSRAPIQAPHLQFLVSGAEPLSISDNPQPCHPQESFGREAVGGGGIMSLQKRGVCALSVSNPVHPDIFHTVRSQGRVFSIAGLPHGESTVQVLI